MSHYETPQQEQIRRLRELIQARDQRSVKHEREIQNLRKQMETENQQLREKLNRERHQWVEDRENLSRELQDIDQELTASEEQRKKDLQRMQSSYEEQIQRMNEGFKSEKEDWEREVSQARKEMEKSLKQIRKDTEKKLQAQQRKIDKIETREENAKEIAEYWVRGAESRIKEIKEKFHHQLWDEKRLAKLEQDIQDASGDIANGLSGTAVATGRVAFREAQDEEARLEEAEMEWNYYLNVVTEKEEHLLQKLDTAGTRIFSYKMKDVEGKTVELIDENEGIDFWTNGQLSALGEAIKKKKAELVRKAGFSTDLLKKAEEELNGLIEQIESVDNIAENNIAMMVSRLETADRIAGILESEYDMTVWDGNFLDEDCRKKFHAVFENPTTEDLIVVDIEPIADQNNPGMVSNHVLLDFESFNHNPDKREKIKNSVASSMSKIDGEEWSAEELEGFA